MKTICIPLLLLCLLILCTGSKAQAAVDMQAFQAALQEWDQFAAKAVGRFRALSPKKADALYLGEDSPLARPQDISAIHQLERIVAQILDRNCEETIAEAEKNILNTLKDHGLTAGCTEGCGFLWVDDDFFFAQLADRFSPDLRAFITLRLTQPEYLVEDACLCYTLQNYGKWAVAWEKFARENPTNRYLPKAQAKYSELLSLMLMSSLDNAPAFPRRNGGKMEQSWRKALQEVAQSYPDTKTAALITDFLSAIQKKSYALSPSVKKTFQKRLRHALGVAA